MALAAADRLDEMLFALATAAERRVGKFNAQELANMAWAFRKADRSCTSPVVGTETVATQIL